MGPHTLAQLLTLLLSSTLCHAASIVLHGWGPGCATEDVASTAVTNNVTVLSLPRSGTAVKINAMRFSGVAVPTGATINSCSVQFTSGTPPGVNGNVSLMIYAELSASSSPLYNANRNISYRTRTTAYARWVVSNWTTASTAGGLQMTPDLSPVLQEVVSLSGWASGASLVLMFVIDPASGSSTATRYASNTGSGPELWVTYTPAAGAANNGWLSDSTSFVTENGMIVGIVLGSVFVIAVLATVLYRRRRRGTTLKYESFEVHASQITVLEQIGVHSMGNVLRVKAANVNGELGRTVDGCAKQLPSLDGSKEKAEREYLLKEARVMMQYASPTHSNVLRLLAVVTKSTPNFIILEFMSNGKLSDLLTKYRPNQTRRASNAGLVPLAPGLRMRFAADIAAGMSFLAARGYVHKCLRARDCYLDENMRVKVGGIGKSAHITGHPKRTQENTLKKYPIRWMAPEALKVGKYSTASDVWSFGIVMWEIESLGIMPYPQFSELQVIDMLADGYRLPHVSGCSTDLHALIQQCWVLNPKERPNFDSLHQRLTGIYVYHCSALTLSDLNTYLPTNQGQIALQALLMGTSKAALAVDANDADGDHYPEDVPDLPEYPDTPPGGQSRRESALSQQAHPVPVAEYDFSGVPQLKGEEGPFANRRPSDSSGRSHESGAHHDSPSASCHNSDHSGRGSGRGSAHVAGHAASGNAHRHSHHSSHSGLSQEAPLGTTRDSLSVPSNRPVNRSVSRFLDSGEQDAEEVRKEWDRNSALQSSKRTVWQHPTTGEDFDPKNKKGKSGKHARPESENYNGMEWDYTVMPASMGGAAQKEVRRQNPLFMDDD